MVWLAWQILLLLYCPDFFTWQMTRTCGRFRLHSELENDCGICKLCILASLNSVPAEEGNLCFLEASANISLHFFIV